MNFQELTAFLVAVITAVHKRISHMRVSVAPVDLYHDLKRQQK